MPPKDKQTMPPVIEIADKKNLIIIAVLFIAGFVVFGNIFENKLIWDDYYQITSNWHVRNFEVGKIFTTHFLAGSEGMTSNFYRPLVIFTFAAEYRLWGLNPAGFRTVNILIHILTAILVYFLFLTLRSGRTVSFLTAFLFTIHPIAVESVTYTASMSELLPVLFMILTVFCYTKYQYAEKYTYIFIYYAGSIFAFILAILSKESSVIIPFLLAILHLTFIDRAVSWRNAKKIFSEILPYILISAAYSVFRLTFLRFDTQTDNLSSINWDISSGILQFLKALFVYFKILIFPSDLHFRLDTVLPVEEWDLQIFLVLLILIPLIYFSFRSLHKKGLLFFGLSWFFIGLFPVSGILLKTNFSVGERWLRLPSIGIFFLFAIVLTEIWLWLSKKPKIARIFPVFLLCAYFVFLGSTTLATNRFWKDGVTYFSYLLRYYPNGPGVHLDLANALMQDGREEEAMREYSQAAAEFEKFISAGITNANTYVYLYKIYTNLGQYEKAATTMIKFRDAYPGAWQPYWYLGQSFENLNNPALAKYNYEKALNLNPVNSEIQRKIKSLGR